MQGWLKLYRWSIPVASSEYLLCYPFSSQIIVSAQISLLQGLGEDSWFSILKNSDHYKGQTNDLEQCSLTLTTLKWVDFYSQNFLSHPYWLRDSESWSPPILNLPRLRNIDLGLWEIFLWMRILERTCFKCSSLLLHQSKIKNKTRADKESYRDKMNLLLYWKPKPEGIFTQKEIDRTSISKENDCASISKENDSAFGIHNQICQTF